MKIEQNIPDLMIHGRMASSGIVGALTSCKTAKSMRCCLMRTCLWSMVLIAIRLMLIALFNEICSKLDGCNDVFFCMYLRTPIWISVFPDFYILTTMDCFFVEFYLDRIYCLHKMFAAHVENRCIVIWGGGTNKITIHCNCRWLSFCYGSWHFSQHCWHLASWPFTMM